MAELDEVIAAARHADAGAAERWFRLLCDPDRDGDGGAAGTVAALREHDPPAAEALELALAGLTEPGQVLREVRDLGPDAALARYYELLGADADAGPGAGAREVAEDPAAWNAFLAENGPYWDGTEDNWPAFRDWFAYQAGQAGVPHSAGAFLDYAESTGDKAAAFAEYGIPLPAAGAQEAAEDPAAWNAFLAENGRYWDGTEENWPAFRDWFAYQAAAAGVPQSAGGFLDYAESSGDKADVFAAYGVPLASAAPAGEAAPEPPPGLEDQIAAAFADNPQALAELSDAEITKLARQAAEALLAGRG
jgi:hypothetical protein